MIGIVFLLDQFSKYWILYILNLPSRGSITVMPGFNLTMVWNKAITFGMLSNLGRMAPVIFSGLAFIIAFSLFIWMLRVSKLWIVMSLGAIIGGAIGNIVDRLRFGAVVDFIHLYVGQWSWYVFNIADSAIVCGVGMLLADAIFHWQSKP